MPITTIIVIYSKVPVILSELVDEVVLYASCLILLSMSADQHHIRANSTRLSV